MDLGLSLTSFNYIFFFVIKITSNPEIDKDDTKQWLEIRLVVYVLS